MTTTRSGLTLIEVMTAVALGTFVCAIGFTGVNAFGKAITRSKQFTSETELITAAVRMADDRADQGMNTLPVQNPVPAPRNWTVCKMNPDSLEFTLQVKDSQVGGDIHGGLNMDSTRKNTLVVQALFIYDNAP